MKYKKRKKSIKKKWGGSSTDHVKCDATSDLCGDQKDSKERERKSGKDIIIMTYGRFNPPTKGHERLFNKLFEKKKKKQDENEDGNYKVVIGTSMTTGNEKNPLDPKLKEEIIKKMISNNENYSEDNDNIVLKRNAFDLINEIKEDGVEEKNIFVYLGSDQTNNDDKGIKKPSDQQKLKGLGDRLEEYFPGIHVLSLKRNLKGNDASNLRDISATMVREAVKKGKKKKDKFYSLLSDSLSKDMKDDIYSKIESSKKKTTSSKARVKTTRGNSIKKKKKKTQKKIRKKIKMKI